MALSGTPQSTRVLPWYLAHWTLNTFFALWTFGGSAFLLFLAELGLPKEQIGVVLSLFPFCGLLALFFAPVAARLGRKRVFIACYGTRKVVMAGLLLVPWLLAVAGRPVAIAWLFGVIGLFAVLRALAETGYYPWSQEFIPNRERGRFGALGNVIGMAASCVALAVAARVVGHGEGLGRFLWLIGAGCIIGIAGVSTMLKVPGGAPLPSDTHARSHWQELGLAMRDRNFVWYLAGNGAVTLATIMLFSFLPLYVHEQLGVASGRVVMLDIAVMAGGAFSSLLGGWLADRVGSRPILMPAVIANALAPLGWLLLPRDTPHLVGWCLLLYFVHGAAGNAIIIAANRILFNNVIPPERSTAYTSVYYAWMGLSGGAAPLLAGALLAATGHWQPTLAGHALDGYALLFLISLVSFIIGWAAYWQVRPDDLYTTRGLLYGVAERLFRRLGPPPWR